LAILCDDGEAETADAAKIAEEVTFSGEHGTAGAAAYCHEADQDDVIAER
jgi:hypothetical protein